MGRSPGPTVLWTVLWNMRSPRQDPRTTSARFRRVLVGRDSGGIVRFAPFPGSAFGRRAPLGLRLAALEVFAQRRRETTLLFDLGFETILHGADSTAGRRI